MGTTRVQMVSEVQHLVERLLDADRDRPWVVVTTQVGRAAADFAVDELQSEAGDVARVLQIETGELTRELSRLLPDRLGVYGGMVRSYPVGRLFLPWHCASPVMQRVLSSTRQYSRWKRAGHLGFAASGIANWAEHGGKDGIGG